MTQSGKVCVVSHCDIEVLCGTSLFHRDIVKDLEARGFSCHLTSPHQVNSCRFNIKFLWSSLKTIFRSIRSSEDTFFSEDSTILDAPLFKKKFKSIFIGNCSNIDFFVGVGGLEQQPDLLDLDFIYTSLGNISTLQIVRKLIAMNPRARLIIHFYDDWMGTTNTFGLLGVIHGFVVSKMVNNLAEQAHRILAISPRLAHLVELRFARDVDVLFRWPTNELLGFTKTTKKQTHLPRATKVIYVGSVSAHSQYHTIIQFADVLTQSVESAIEMEIYTDQQFLPKSHRLRCFDPPKNDQTYFAILTQADWVLIPAPNDNLYNYTSASIPAKIWSCILLANRILYIGSPYTEQAELLRSFGAFRLNRTDKSYIEVLLNKNSSDNKPTIDQVTQRLEQISKIQKNKLQELFYGKD